VEHQGAREPQKRRAKALPGPLHLKGETQLDTTPNHAGPIPERADCVLCLPDHDEGETTLYLAQLGQAYAEAGRVEQAREVLRRLETTSQSRYVSPYHIAYVYIGLGEHERALDLLERAYDERSGSLYGIKGSFLFTALHAHPRFVSLLRRMNLN